MALAWKVCGRALGCVVAVTGMLAALPPLAGAQDTPQDTIRDGDRDGSTRKVKAQPFISDAEPYEERLVGPNRQPEWTTERPFATSRVYVLPPGMFEFEQWWRGTYKKGGTEAHRFLSEVAVGLPGRWQLDLYGRVESQTGSSARYVGEQVEARYALAEWGRLPANPTLYLEYKNNRQGPHVLEGKLLLADRTRSGLHWAANLSYEEEQGGSREIERALTFAVSKSVRDSRFSVGLEAVLENVTARGAAAENNLLIGPSFQWRPNRTMHVDFVPLFGASRDAPHSQIFIVFGINLGGTDRAKQPSEPVSSRQR